VEAGSAVSRPFAPAGDALRSRSHWAIGLAASHASRLAATPAGRGLDDRTWADLNLDEVFVALDHTHSTLGQHALYHRLRTAPLGDHLDAFESLVSGLSGDAATRERAQLALAPLQDADGYNLWWMLDGDALARRGWYRVFPCLTAAAFIAIVLAPLWPWAPCTWPFSSTPPVSTSA